MIYLNSLNCQDLQSLQRSFHPKNIRKDLDQLKQDIDLKAENYEIKKNYNQKNPLHSVFTHKQKIIAYFIFIFWLLIFIDFVFWWFTKTTPRLMWAYSLTTLTVFWLPVLGLYFFIFSLRQKEIKIDHYIPPCRVAMVATKIPSEPEELLHRTLEAMKRQDFPYPYDVWLCDEDPSQSMLDWCQSKGVNVSTRKHDSSYHNNEYPRKAKSKEGNLMYFFDKYGYDNYDYVSQFDADHAPEKDFLKETIKYFNDPKVGYVSTPSITDGNLEDSWTVLARCYWEATTHGPMQAGANNGFSPMMFGSHYTHRTKALRSIGGIAPEIAEDHTTTLVYNASGWKGSFSRDAIAHGYGAVGVVDSMVQEYQWALVGMRAMFLVLPKFFWSLPGKLKFQFLVWESWYPLLILVTLISYFLPVFALKSGNAIVNVEGWGFLWHYLPLNFIFVFYVWWLRSCRQLRPVWSWQVSWETFIFQILQFPWILLGILAGLYEVISGSKKTKIKITDKTEKVKNIGFLFFLPHFIVVAINCWGVLSTPYAGDAYGYYWFSFAIIVAHAIAIFFGVYLSIIESFRHLDEQGRFNYIKKNLATVCFTTVTLFFTVVVFQHILTSFYAL
jgi:cellulose synthase (UDP-forming)